MTTMECFIDIAIAKKKVIFFSEQLKVKNTII